MIPSGAAYSAAWVSGFCCRMPRRATLALVRCGSRIPSESSNSSALHVHPFFTCAQLRCSWMVSGFCCHMPRRATLALVRNRMPSSWRRIRSLFMCIPSSHARRSAVAGWHLIDELNLREIKRNPNQGRGLVLPTVTRSCVSKAAEPRRSEV